MNVLISAEAGELLLSRNVQKSTFYFKKIETCQSTNLHVKFYENMQH